MSRCKQAAMDQAQLGCACCRCTSHLKHERRHECDCLCGTEVVEQAAEDEFSGNHLIPAVDLTRHTTLSGVRNVDTHTMACLCM